MYILISYEGNRIKTMEYTLLSTAKNDKGVLERNGIISCIFNTTFMSGINEVKELMLKNDFYSTMGLLSLIEDIENGLL